MVNLLPIPLIIAASYMAVTAVQGLYNAYSTEQTSRSSDKVASYSLAFNKGALYENSDFWDRYIRAHHLQNRKIRFPYRTGYNFNETGVKAAENSLLYNQWSRFNSYANAGFGTARAGIGAYGVMGNTYRPQKNYTDVMYG